MYLLYCIIGFMYYCVYQCIPVGSKNLLFLNTIYRKSSVTDGTAVKSQCSKHISQFCVSKSNKY